MKYSARTRRSMVDLFKLALANLPDVLVQPDNRPHCSPYICDAIRFSTSNYGKAEVATNFIAERINYAFSIEHWLTEQSKEIADAVQYDVLCNDGRKLQAYRKAWLQSLIKEFEATV
jgi:hypothetical protein